MTPVLHELPAMQETAEALRASGKRVALVPTMGFLHEGHLSLIRLAREHADVVVTTIFVNPLQFGPAEDFTRYPRDVEADTLRAFAAGTDYLFVPSVAGMYPPDHRTVIDVGPLGEVLEGKSRPGHFQGVATVVAKLFHLTVPQVAVFGQKDAQQVAVIRRMVRDLNFCVRIVVGPIVREADGLAMSSRNVYLTPEQRVEAVVLHRALRLAEQLVAGGLRDCSEIIRRMTETIRTGSHGSVDYISVADASSLRELDALVPRQETLILLAVRFDTTRLIDNSLVTAP